jgi:hypothetical protein
MEIMEGKVIDPLDESLIERVASVLDYFVPLRHTIPGPLYGRVCRSLLFSKAEDSIF